MFSKTKYLLKFSILNLQNVLILNLSQKISISTPSLSLCLDGVRHHTYHIIHTYHTSYFRVLLRTVQILSCDVRYFMMKMTMYKYLANNKHINHIKHYMRNCRYCGNRDDDYMIKNYFGVGGSAFDDDDEKYHYDHLKYYPLQELFTYSCASTKTSKQKTNHIKEEVPNII